jgi:hypothetical protein
MRARLIVLALNSRILLALAGLAAASPKPPTFERAVEVTGPGRLAITLDRDAYEGARADLGDLRVVDDRGREVPYWLDRGEVGSSERRRPEIRNRGFLRGRQATAVLDFGSVFPKSGLGLSLSGDNFRRRVMAEGSEDGRNWVTLTDDAYVFAVPPPDAARYEWIQLPRGDHRWVRVTVFHGPDDPGRIEIRDAWTEVGRAASAERPVALVTQSRAEDPERHETILTLDLGARHQPFRAILLDVQDARFFRGVAVEARREPPPRRPGERPRSVTWALLGECAIYRYEEGGRKRESRRVEVAGRERVVRLRLRNRDDQPLGLGAVTVLAPVERLVFESAEGGRYRITYGQPDLPAPQYDLVRTLPDPPAWVAGAVPAGLAAAAPRAAQTPRVPRSESHPALLWAGLLGAVAALGALTWGALKRAS